MKTIALSMIFSLVVIVCEEQTLFAPHIVTFDGLRAANPNISCLVCTELCDCKPGNSLVPIAGVNRSVPLAGRFDLSSTSTQMMPEDDMGHNLMPEDDMGHNLMPEDDMGHNLEYGPGMHDSLHNNGAFLPWHRGYFGLSGTAGPGGSSF